MSKNDLYHKIKIEDLTRRLDSVGTIFKSKSKALLCNNLEYIDEGSVNLIKGANLGDIKNFERKLGINLPPDYRKFLEFTNGAGMYGLVFYNLNEVKTEHMPIEFGDAAERTRKLEHTYGIASWGTGDYVLMNFQSPTGAKDSNRRDIIDFCHDPQDARVIAKSFGEFLYRILEGAKVHDDKVDDPKYWEEMGTEMPNKEELKSRTKAFYWLEPKFKPYREYYWVEVDT